MWSVLTKNYKQYSFSHEYDYPNSYVQLKALNNKRLVATLYIDTNRIDQKVFKGKLKNDYFSVRRKVKYFGLPFFYLKSSDYKLQLSKDRNNRLLIDGVNGRFGWILIMTAGNNDHYNFIFEAK